MATTAATVSTMAMMTVPATASLPTYHTLTDEQLHDMTLRSLKQLTMNKFSTADVLRYFDNSYSVYETLMRSLSDDKHYYGFPNPLRRPLVFYLGHTACFYINKFVAAGLLTEAERVNAHFEEIFAVGVDEMSWDDMIDDHFAWPSVAEVWEYRQNVRQVVERIIQETRWSFPVSWNNPKQWVIFMGIEHERIHLETSSVLIREFAIANTKKPAGWKYGPTLGMPPQNKMVKISGGTARVGKPRSYPTYGWDCEYGDDTARVAPFEVSQFKVTNAEWLNFINAHGYETREYWCDEGWRWVQYTKARHPHFWVPLDASKYRFRVMYDIIEMPWDWPVEVNYLEAKAYCRWKGDGYRLITEHEWHLMSGMADKSNDDLIRSKDPALGSHTTDESTHFNFDMVLGSSTPVNFFPPNENGIYDVFGNVWEWSESSFDGKPGFYTHDLYMDFSTPCFDGKHNMMLGGSWASTGNETSVYARYAFRRHFFQHAGFRLVRSLPEENIYETRSSLDQYIHFHYAPPSDILPYNFGPVDALEFPARCAQLCWDSYVAVHGPDAKPQRALDIGCATGRSSFELARHVPYVLGVDYSHAFARFCNDLKITGAVSYRICTEGSLSKELAAKIDPAIDRSRTEFRQGDAHDLTPFGGSFDIVLAANLIDRLHTPDVFLEQLSSTVRAGGIVVLTSPYTWLENFTAREKWLGGYLDADGNEVTTFETLKRLLGQHFELLSEQPMQFLIYEHQRKFQWSVAHATAWRRK